MTLPGGGADKLGNYYEEDWTLACLGEVMDEEADAIRLEPPGEEGEGAEFWLRRGSVTEYHQAKLGSWTLKALADKGVLPRFGKKLADPAAACVFVCTEGAPVLKELANRARKAVSVQAFRQEFLAGNQKLAREFDQLRGYWGEWIPASAESSEAGELRGRKKRQQATQSGTCIPCSDEAAYLALKRAFVRTIDEETLKERANDKLKTLVAEDPERTRGAVRQLLQESLYQQLTTYDIWHWLANHGLRRRQWDRDPHLLVALQAATDQFVRLATTDQTLDLTIAREEERVILDLITPATASNGTHAILISGEAGVGKSSVVVQVVETLGRSGVPVLALRADRLEQMQLPASPVKVLAKVAHEERCVLVIDQLESAGRVSASRPELLDRVGQILEEARAYPQLRLLLVCREFDLESDERLQQLVRRSGGKRIPIRPLAHAAVQEVVRRLGFDAGRLTARQLDLLALPLYLRLLAESTNPARSDALDFHTIQDLYNRFWIYKQQAIADEQLGRIVRWTEVVDALCWYMSTREDLWAPQVVVDTYALDAQAMASAHVLTWDGRRYAFFHEGFFDYAFARRFSTQEQGLADFLVHAEQSLFRRAQVRQILAYERAVDRERYLADLTAVLSSPQVLSHIKQVALSFLAELPDPQEREWYALAPLIRDPSAPGANLAWATLGRSIAWFQLLDSLDQLRAWLADPNEYYVKRTLDLLLQIQRRAAQELSDPAFREQVIDRIAELLEPYAGTSPAWRQWLLLYMQWADLDYSERFFALFLRLIDDGTLDTARGPIAVNSDFWDLISSLPDRHPDWACQVIGHYFRRRLMVSQAAGIANPFDSTIRGITSSIQAGEIFEKSARGTPTSFIAEVLPFMQEVMALTAVERSQPPWRDQVWAYRNYRETFGIVTDDLLAAMETALSTEATNDPDAFGQIAAQLQDLPFETAQFLLVRAYTANGARFADEAIAYLSAIPARLRTGYSGDQHWATRELLAATTPHCSDKHLSQIEDLILHYYPDWEREAERRQARGFAQLTLLEAIAPARRSPEVVRRLEELYRKFGRQAVAEPLSTGGGFVGSPIPETVAAKMTDEQWLRAITRYESDRLDIQRDGQVVGGATQLAAVLESRTRREPHRFAALLLRFPQNAHLSYFDAVLRGIAEVEIDQDLACQVCRRCHELPGHPHGVWIAWVVQKHPGLSWPQDILEIIAWYAAVPTEPRNSTAPAELSSQALETEGINSAHGSAAEAIAALISQDCDRLPPFRSALERLVQDPSLAVRSCTAAALIAVWKCDRDLAIRLFQLLCQASDALLATRYVDAFLSIALPEQFAELRAILERMLSADLPDVVRAGSARLCSASLLLEEARTLAESCLGGTQPQRLGAATAFADQLTDPRFRVRCQQALSTLFNDPDDDVQKAAAGCFWKLRGQPLGEYTVLIEAFLASRAFATGANYVINLLSDIRSQVPKTACLVCERYLDLAGPAIADIRTGFAAQAPRIAESLKWLYNHSKERSDREIESQCLQLIDRLVQAGAYGINTILAEFSR